jgi:DNA repair photolyase
MRIKIGEIKARSIITPSRLPDADYVVNPYTGCSFGCAYCYASFMGRFVNEQIADWGSYVYVKSNAVELFKNEIKKLKDKNKSIFLSSVTDPYMGVEATYKLTRGILECLVEVDYKGEVGILTKSPLVLRDVDLFKRLKNSEVGMTITTTDDRLSRFLEVGAPTGSKRIEALKELNRQGVRTYAFIGPLLPHFRYKPELLEMLFKDIAATGTKSIYVEHINLKPYIKERLWKVIENEPEDIRSIYKGAELDEHRNALDSIVADLIKKYNFRLMLGEVLYHSNWMLQEGK